MLARFRVLLPYFFSIPYHDYIRLKPQEFPHDEYLVKLYPPKMANADSSITEVTSATPLMDVVSNLDEAAVVTPTSAIKVNNQEAIRANLLQIDLLAAREFARDRNSRGIFDPPLELLIELANRLIGRLKSAGRMAKPTFIDLDSAAAWKVQYLTDDGQTLEENEKLVRAHTGHKLRWQISAITHELWELAMTLPVDFSLPIWHKLILDATAQLPDVNTSIVLANAALESFIKVSLDILAKQSSSISDESWKWLSDRDDVLLKQPSVKENFDQVLTLLTGKSLRRDQPELWKAFDEMRAARNSMVHEGKATIKIRRKRKAATTSEVTSEMARSMVDNASRIIGWIESLLPEEHKRLIFAGSINYQLVRSATGPENANTELVAIKGDLNKLKLRFGKER